MPKTTQRNWTEDEVQTATAMRREKKSAQEIADALGRTLSSVRRKLEKMRVPRSMNGRSESAFIHERADYVEARRPTEDMLRERDQRVITPARDLTGFLLGDPPRGYSALDKMEKAA